MDGINVLSCFDGMSCAQIALERAGIKVNNYYASEVDKYAIKVTQENYPNTIQVGDITEVTRGVLPCIDLLIGGSPCQGFSFAGKQLNFDDPRSKLFFEFVRLKNELQPEYFLLENVRMKKEYQDVISEALGVEPININSNLVSAQNRNRYYWTNIPFLGMPEDKRIFLKDIMHEQTSEYVKVSKKGTYKKFQDKASCLTGGGNSGGNHSDMDLIGIDRNRCFHIGEAIGINGHDLLKRVYADYGKSPTVTTITGGNQYSEIACGAQRGRYLIDGVRQDGKMLTAGKTKQYMEVRGDGKTNTLTTVSKDNNIVYNSECAGRYEVEDLIWRRLTPIECERLQTVPDNYTNHVSNSQRYKMLGNGFTVDVIAHILKGMLIR